MQQVGQEIFCKRGHFLTYSISGEKYFSLSFEDAVSEDWLCVAGWDMTCRIREHDERDLLEVFPLGYVEQWLLLEVDAIQSVDTVLV